MQGAYRVTYDSNLDRCYYVIKTGVTERRVAFMTAPASATTYNDLRQGALEWAEEYKAWARVSQLKWQTIPPISFISHSFHLVTDWCYEWSFYSSDCRSGPTSGTI